MNELIDDLSSDGARDSSGAFTVSMDKAREKLSQFALANPRFYVLNLLASAVAAEATIVNLSLTAEKVCITHNGQAPRARALENLWSELVHPTSTSLYELAVALNAARTLSPSELTVESFADGQGLRLQIRGDKLELQETDLVDWEHQTCTTRFTLREAAFLKPMRSMMGSPEQAILRGYPHLGPAKVSLNGLLLTAPVALADSPRTAAWTHLAPGPARLEAAPPTPEWAPDCLIEGPSISKGSYEAVMILAPPDVCRQHGMLLINNGVTFRRKSLPGYDFISGVILVGHLRKNLSHTDLAEDETYRDLIAAVQSQADLLIARRLEDPRPLPADLVRALLLEAPFLVDRLTSRKLLASARVVERWQKEARFAEDILDPERWRALCAELYALEGSPARDVLETRLRSTLRRTGQSLFQTGQTHQTSSHWERIVSLGKLLPSPWVDEEAEELLLLQALNGRAVDPLASSTQAVQATLLRLQLRPDDALELCACPLTKAETLLALGRTEPAEELLRRCLTHGTCPRSAETLSDLLAFTAPPDPKRRKEALLWRERATEWRRLQWDDAPSFMAEDTAKLARSVVSFYAWVPYRARASRSWSGPAAELAKELTEGREALRSKPLGALSIKSAVLAAESSFGPGHIVVELARSRAAHFLREANQWAEADDLLARGHLIRLLQERWHTTESAT